MSFKGAASAVLVLVIVGAILGNMATNQLPGSQQSKGLDPTPPESSLAPTSQAAQLEGASAGDGRERAAGEGGAGASEHQSLAEWEKDLQRREEKLAGREEELQRREEDLAAKIEAFEAMLADVTTREGELENAWAEIEALMDEIAVREAEVKEAWAEIARERDRLREGWALLHQQQNALGWAYAALFVLALMTALAMAATAVHRRTRRRAGAVSRAGELRRAYLRPNGQHPARPAPSPGQAPRWPAGGRDTHEARIRERIGSLEDHPATAKAVPAAPSGPGGNGRSKK
jgi:hypothetical protein